MARWEVKGGRQVPRRPYVFRAVALEVRSRPVRRSGAAVTAGGVRGVRPRRRHEGVAVRFAAEGWLPVSGGPWGEGRGRGRGPRGRPVDGGLRGE